MTINACFELLMDLLLLLEFLHCNRRQVGQLADFDLISHVLSVAIGKLTDCIKKLIIDGDLVLEGTAIPLVQHLDFVSLLAQVDVEVHCPIDSSLDFILLLINALNFTVLIGELAI